MKNGMEADEYGTKRYYVNGKLHREDGPAIECINGDKIWCQRGQYHRIDGPAIELSNGINIWYYEDKRHRLDGAAAEFPNGTKQWFINGIKIECSSDLEFKRFAELKIFW